MNAVIYEPIKASMSFGKIIAVDVDEMKGEETRTRSTSGALARNK